MTTHPSLEYLLVGCLAAAFTFVLTPLARYLAIRVGAIVPPFFSGVSVTFQPSVALVARRGASSTIESGT